MVYFKKTYYQPNSKDIFEVLIKDFFNKCYLCEDKVDSRFLEEEHLMPKKPKGSKKENRIRKNSWGNLMLACSDCNKRKGNLEPILNPTLPDEKIDEKIAFKFLVDLNTCSESKVVIDLLQQDSEQVKNSVGLLRKIYCEQNAKSKLKRAALMEKLSNEIQKFRDFITDYKNEKRSRRKKELLQSIIEGLSNRTPFTAFKRWMVRDNPQYQEFIQYIQDED